MADRLAGKVAIVTGAGSRAAGIGNGRAAAILFAREGARVLVVDRSRAAAEATLKMILGEGGEAAVFDADVTRSDDCAAMVDDAVRRWGRLDILDNNVGISGRGTVVEVSEEDWERVMRVNVTGMMLASKHAIPVLARGGGGAIVNISSISALRPRGLTPYSASKGAVIALTRAMAIDHAQQGIRVNCVAPGPGFGPPQGVRAAHPRAGALGCPDAPRVRPGDEPAEGQGEEGADPWRDGDGSRRETSADRGNRRRRHGAAAGAADPRDHATPQGRGVR